MLSDMISQDSIHHVTSDFWHVAYVDTRPRLLPITDGSLITDVPFPDEWQHENDSILLTECGSWAPTSLMVESSGI